MSCDFGMETGEGRKKFDSHFGISSVSQRLTDAKYFALTAYSQITIFVY